MALHPLGVSAFAQSRTLFASTLPNFGTLLEHPREVLSPSPHSWPSRTLFHFRALRTAQPWNQQKAPQAARLDLPCPRAAGERPAGTWVPPTSVCSMRPAASPATLRTAGPSPAKRQILPSHRRSPGFWTALRPGRLIPIWIASLAVRQESSVVRFQAAAEILEFFHLSKDGRHYRRIVEGFKRVFGATIFFGTGEEPAANRMIDFARFHFFDSIHLWFSEAGARIRQRRTRGMSSPSANPSMMKSANTESPWSVRS